MKKSKSVLKLGLVAVAVIAMNAFIFLGSTNNAYARSLDEPGRATCYWGVNYGGSWDRMKCNGCVEVTDVSWVDDKDKCRQNVE